MAPSASPPASPGHTRRTTGDRAPGRVESPPQTIDDAQLAQDIDAARQMSRVRASSITHHPHVAVGTGATATGNSHGMPPSPHRIPSGSQAYSSGAATNSIGAGTSTTSTRRPSNAAAANAGDHQNTSPRAFQAGSYPRSPSSPLMSYQQQQQHHHQQEAQAQAARFYMQHHRNGSNTSLDSASHFIDHRNQQASVPQISPQTLQRGSNARRSQNRMEPFSLGESRLRFGSTALEGSAVDEDTSRAHVDDGSMSGSYLGRSAQGHRPSMQTRNSRGTRLVDIGSDDQNEDNIAAGILSPGNTISERPPHTPSRRPSLAEEDVWFPMHAQGGDAAAHDEQHHFDEHVHGAPHSDHEASAHQLPPGFPFTFDLGALEEYAEQERQKTEEEAAENQTGGYGMRRRGATSMSAARNIKEQTPQDAGRRPIPGAYGVSPSSDDATFYSRRPRKFINVPGIEPEVPKSSNRYQRKLAMFEGPGSSPPPAASRGSGGNILGSGPLLQNDRERHLQQMGNGFPADNKSPLMDASGRSMPAYHGGEDWNPRKSEDEEDGAGRVSRSMSVGADLGNLVKRAKGTSRPARGAGIRSNSYNNDRQYRFTFYSNALPNTIHARHLYELPAAGQTFEELLMGIDPQQPKPQEEEDLINMNDPAPQGSDPNAANAAPQSSAAAAAAAADQGAPRSSARAGSALTNVMNAGRLEGSTAPNTGSNTPDHSANPRASMPGRQANAARGGATQGPGNGPAGLSTAQMAAIDKTRTLPGGGLRVDQDASVCTWWLDVLSPTDQEMKMLSRVFGIHPLTTEDILMEETREKIELFRNYYLVCFRSFDQDPYSPTYLEPLNMYVIVFREGTLSFHFRATPHPVNVRRRIKQLKDYINVTSDWISYALIDDITDAFGPLIQSIEYEVDSIDELVLILKEAEQSDMLRRIGTCRKKVMGLLRLMGNKADVVKGLAKRCNENWSVAPKSDIGLYLSDIQDHLITMTQNLNHYEKILSRSHSNYLAQISIEMTDANNQINDVLSKLTALGTVIVPLNVITGLWGMNVNVPGQGVENLDWFFGIISVMVALAVVGYFATIRYLSR